MLLSLYHSLITRIETLKPFDCALYITLIMLVIERPDYQSVVLVSAVAIIVRPLMQSTAYWVFMLLVFLVAHWQPWFSVANHHYLQAYWMLGIALCLLTERKEESLRHTARWLVGGVFLFAVIWKVRTPEILNGTFMEFCLMTDFRLSAIASFIGIDYETVAQNREALKQFTEAGNLLAGLSLTTSEAARPAAIALSYLAVSLELAVAVAFLWPNRKIHEAWRHGLLIGFIVSTYIMAPVAGFGWVLTALGMCQVQKTNRAFWTSLYIVSFIVVFLGSNPGLDGVLMRLGLM